MIVAVPQGNYARGQRCDALVELADLYPTLAELCGLPVPDTLEGTSLVPVLRDPQLPGKRAAFTVAKQGNLMGRSVRTPDWRYTEYTDGSAELYDCRTSRSPSVSLIGNDEYRDIVTEHKALLRGGG